MIEDNKTRQAVMLDGVDGDTFDASMVLLNLGKHYLLPLIWRIRLTIIDTPERGEEGYKEATDFTKQFVGQPIALVIHKMEPHGRILADAYVMYEGKQENLSSLLLQKGSAKVYGK
jgi:micrococcal nuclease